MTDASETSLKVTFFDEPYTSSIRSWDWKFVGTPCGVRLGPHCTELSLRICYVVIRDISHLRLCLLFPITRYLWRIPHGDVFCNACERHSVSSVWPCAISRGTPRGCSVGGVLSRMREGCIPPSTPPCEWGFLFSCTPV